MAKEGKNEKDQSVVAVKLGKVRPWLRPERARAHPDAAPRHAQESAEARGFVPVSSIVTVDVLKEAIKQLDKEDLLKTCKHLTNFGHSKMGEFNAAVRSATAARAGRGGQLISPAHRLLPAC